MLSKYIRDLGIYTDCDTTFRQPVSSVVFRYLTLLILLQLDCGSVALTVTGISRHLLDRVGQSVINASASLVYMPNVKLSTIGSRAFPVAASRIWNAQLRAAQRRDIGIDSAVIPAATEDLPVQTVFLKYCSTLSGSRSDVVI